MTYMVIHDGISRKIAMPNIMTHTIFAEDVFHTIGLAKLQELIKEELALFYIGSNGPDFLFFYHVKPWEAHKSHTLNRLGSKVHKQGINAFYEEAISCIKHQKNKRIQQRMFVYLLGHLCHWALDKTTHPYIFYRTGNCKGQSASYHHRLESMIDTEMLLRKKQTTIVQSPPYEIAKTNDEILQAIARIYVPVAKKVYDVDVKVYELRKALQSWYDVLKVLYDPKGYKYRMFYELEKKLKIPWKLSGYIIRHKEESDLDILNEQHQEWRHPCDENMTFTTSFLDLYDMAIKEANEVIEAVYACIYEEQSFDRVASILKDASYETGMQDASLMYRFDLIFENVQSE